MIKLFKTWRSN